MNVMLGADADELDRIADEFRKAADELDAEGSVLTGVLNRVSWLGDVATSYLENWTGIQIPKIGVSTQFLRDAATRLTKDAAEQRAASLTDGAGGGGAGGSGPPGTAPPGSTPTEPGDEDEESDNPALDAIEEMLDGLGLTATEIDEMLEVLKDLDPETLQYLEDHVLGPDVVKALKTAGHAIDAAGLVIDIVRDFTDPDNAGLPFDERVVHAATDAAVRFAISEGVEKGSMAAVTAIIGALTGGAGAVPAAMAGKVIGLALAEVVNYGVDKLDDGTDFIDSMSDEVTDGYRWAKENLHRLEDLATLPMDITIDAINTGQDILDGGKDLVADGVKDIGGFLGLD